MPPMTIYSQVQMPNLLRLNMKWHDHHNLFAVNQYQCFAGQNVLPAQNAHLSTVYVLKQIDSIYRWYLDLKRAPLRL